MSVESQVEKLLQSATAENLISIIQSKSKLVQKKPKDVKGPPGKYVFYFSKNYCEGKPGMKAILGGKGSGLAEMAGIGLPVPPGFTITTEMCDVYYKLGQQYPPELNTQVEEALARLEKETGKKFGDLSNPLLVSVRSGAAVSMPGMMDTVLNLGLNDISVEGVAKQTGNPRFAWDSYRRFISMFGNVVKSISGEEWEHVLSGQKKKRNVKLDNELSAEDLKEVVTGYKAVYKKNVGQDFPQEPKSQLWQAINAVFGSWNNPRANKYREINDIKGLLGTAVNVQSMVFGNSGNESATGVCFSRNPSTGDNKYYGEYLINAQGEDVVAGIRTPQQMSKEMSLNWAKENSIAEEVRAKQFPSLEESMPEAYKELVHIKNLLQNHYRDMQDMEFTIENRKVYMLQTRNGKRTAFAAVKIAVDMVKEGLIEEHEAISRVDAKQLDQLLHPMIDPTFKGKTLAKGLPASPGAAVGKIVFTAEEAEEWVKRGEKVVLVRIETSPEDIGGMNVAQGILTARGGMTSHAAVVARGMGKCCVAGCGEVSISGDKCTIAGNVFKRGDFISLNGNTGEVFSGQAPLVEAALTGDFGELMAMCFKYKKLKVRANADTPRDVEVSVKFGAEGVGLCRTEHMFFEGNRIAVVREMIVAQTKEKREAALAKLLPIQRGDFHAMFVGMGGRPVTIRLLDPPLHEFVPHDETGPEAQELAKVLGMPLETVKQRIHSLKESNPMLGHRGCRLGITYPEIYDMQVRAIFEAACDVKALGKPVAPPEVMIPLVGKLEEFTILRDNTHRVAKDVMAEKKMTFKYMVGTMIEVPRAAVTADAIAREAEFFSFGTNDLTQMGCGFSRDDAGVFLGDYVKLGIYDKDPFQVIDKEGIGELVKMAVAKGRSVRPKLKCGVCGEHGGDPTSVKFFHTVPLTYVSCSPYRVPVAILAAAQAAVAEDYAE